MSKKKTDTVYMRYSGKIPVTLKEVGHVLHGFIVPVPKEICANLAEDKNWHEVEVSVVEKKKTAAPAQSTTTAKVDEKKEVKNGRGK